MALLRYSAIGKIIVTTMLTEFLSMISAITRDSRTALCRDIRGAGHRVFKSLSLIGFDRRAREAFQRDAKIHHQERTCYAQASTQTQTT